MTTPVLYSTISKLYTCKHVPYDYQNLSKTELHQYMILTNLIQECDLIPSGRIKMIGIHQEGVNIRRLKTISGQL